MARLSTSAPRAKKCPSMNDAEVREWKSRMEPILERTSLEEVAKWWLDMWEWRTAELEAGRGNPYDASPSYRAPWSVVTAKFPWLTQVNDRIDLSAFVAAGMKERSKTNPAMKVWYKDYLKEKRDFERKRR